MGLLPLPSHVHYELLLQLLERQTLPTLEMGSEQYIQVQQIIIHLRKALSVQRQLETNCQDMGLPIEHRWSLNPPPPVISPHILATPIVELSVQPPSPLNPA